MQFTPHSYLIASIGGNLDALRAGNTPKNIPIPEEIAKVYEEYFKAREKDMNILPAQYFPRATAHVPQMIKIIEGLVAKGFAYEKNGNVFFDVTKFEDYGKLSGNTLQQLKVGARLEEHPDKRNPWDFALWLKAPKEHILKWQSPWSLGYPGWHIECSAMSTEYLGNTVDIHTGAEDNIFPHHEAEIAQTQCYTGQQFVKYWIHTRHLLIEGEKMSKSKGNLYKLEDVVEQGFSAMDLRMLFLSSHYRSRLDFSWDALTQAKKNLQRINDFVLNLEALGTRNAAAEEFNISTNLEKFEAAMDDDLNTPLALSNLYELITQANKRMANESLSSKDAHKLISLWKKMNIVFGFILKGQAEIPDEIMQIVKEREQARKGKDFKKSDDLRTLLENKGFVIEDTKDGPVVKSAS